MGFRSLRLINEDYIAGGMRFGEHPHQNMEILTYVASGSFAHRDSTGNQEEINADDVQQMSAGSGVRHGEFTRILNTRFICFRSGFSPTSKGSLRRMARNDQRPAALKWARIKWFRCSICFKDGELYLLFPESN